MVAKSCSDRPANLLYTLLDPLQYWPRCTLRGCDAIGGIHSVEPTAHDLFPLSLQLCELILLRGELCPEFHTFGFLLGDESQQVCVSCEVIR